MGSAESYRAGTSIITHIEANSVLPDIVGSQLQVTLEPPPISTQQILLYLVNQFPTLKLGAIGNFPTIYNQPVSLNGMAWTLLKLYSSPSTPFIDDGKIYILNNNEVTGGIFVIDDSSGILETPRRSGFMLIVTTLLETGVELIGQMVQIKSTINNFYNGIYKVLMIEHRGTISGAVCGKMVSTFYLQASGLFNGSVGSITPGQGIYDRAIGGIGSSMTQQNPGYLQPSRQTLETLLDAVKYDVMKNINCAKVGTIQSFNAALQGSDHRNRFHPGY